MQKRGGKYISDEDWNYLVKCSFNAELKTVIRYFACKERFVLYIQPDKYTFQIYCMYFELVVLKLFYFCLFLLLTYD